MLVEVRCDKFVSNGKTREPIRFHAGLNAVLGDDNGSNSIGKSTFLMILDFVFGGSDYVKKCVDVQENVKEHTICFAFSFDGQTYYFSRNTVDYNNVVKCDAEYQALPDEDPLSLQQYGEFLCEHYDLSAEGITWRGAIARFIRVYKRDTLDEERPLRSSKDEKTADAKAIKLPRIEVASCSRADISQAGVYFLFCKEDDGADSVYIGEAENVKERLVQHLRDYQSEKEKFYWNTAMIFVGRDLNKALIRYLENRFVEIARSCKRYMVLTKNTYRNTVMKESQVAVMEEFVDNVKILINALGYKVLDPLLQIGTDAVAVDDEELFINTGNTSATGMVTSEGFVVLKGAVVNEKTSAKSLSAGMKKLRDKIFADGKVENMTTTEDILFSSSSAAAEFVLGYSASGPRTWKAKDGRTLKEIEDNATAD